MSGCFTIVCSLSDRFRAHGPFFVAVLQALTVADCLRTFHQDPANDPIRTLIGHFAVALNDLGHCAEERFGSDFSALLARQDCTGRSPAVQ